MNPWAYLRETDLGLVLFEHSTGFNDDNEDVDIVRAVCHIEGVRAELKFEYEEELTQKRFDEIASQHNAETFIKNMQEQMQGLVEEEA